MELDERISLLMQENNWKVRDVAVISGVTSSSVSQWLGVKGIQTKKITNMAAAERLAKASGYNALWIAQGIGEKTEMRHARKNQKTTGKPVTKPTKPSIPAIIANPEQTPFYATAGAAGMDLYAGIEAEIEIPARTHAMVGTGLRLDLSSRPDIAAVIMSRSGMYNKHHLRVGQGVGLVDADYQGELKVMLYNESDQAYRLQPGERISQVVFMPVIQVELAPVEQFELATERGEGGFGSTGKT